MEPTEQQDAEQIWNSARPQLETILGSNFCALWLSACRVEGIIQHGALVLFVPNTIFLKKLDQHKDDILTALIPNGIFKLDIQINPSPAESFIKKREAKPPTEEPKSTNRTLPVRVPHQLPAQSFHEKMLFALPVSLASDTLASQCRDWQVDMVLRGGDSTVNYQWKLTAPKGEHLPGPEAETLRLAIERVLTLRRKERPVRQVEQFTAYDIWRALGKKGKPGKDHYTRIANNLLRTAQTNYLKVFNASDGQHTGRGVERWHFWRKVYVWGDTLPDGTKSQHISIELEDWYREAINTHGHLLPFNDELILALHGEVSRRLLRLLAARSYGRSSSYIVFPYKNLCELLGTKAQVKLKKAKEKLNIVHQELLQLPQLYLEWQKKQGRSKLQARPPVLACRPEWVINAQEWTIRYHPGPGLRTKVRQPTQLKLPLNIK